MRLPLKPAAASLAILCAPLAAQADDDASANKELVVQAVTELFIEGDATAVDRYWTEDYLQHNPNFPSGREVIKGLFGNMPPEFKYEMGMVIAEDDLVALHGRYTGFGPTPMIAVDIFRVEDGKIVEHWDILQNEVTETASGLPMFEPAQ